MKPLEVIGQPPPTIGEDAHSKGINVFKDMYQQSNEYGIRFALPEIIDAAKLNIAIGYEALSYNCASTLVLVNAGVPLRCRW